MVQREGVSWCAWAGGPRPRDGTYELVQLLLGVKQFAAAQLLWDALELRGLERIVPWLGDRRSRIRALVVVVAFCLKRFGEALAGLRGGRCVDGALDLVLEADGLVALLAAELLQAIVKHDLVHVAELALGLPDDELLEQALPVLYVDGFAACKLALDLVLQRDELVVRLAGQQTGDLGLDGRGRARLARERGGADGTLEPERLERRGRDDEERAPELEVRFELLEREVHLDVLVQLLRVLERQVLRTRTESA